MRAVYVRGRRGWEGEGRGRRAEIKFPNNFSVFFFKSINYLCMRTATHYLRKCQTPWAV